MLMVANVSALARWTSAYKSFDPSCCSNDRGVSLRRHTSCSTPALLLHPESASTIGPITTVHFSKSIASLLHQPKTKDQLIDNFSTMFGRRRRPILGAAVVIGASRSAARHEVAQQAQMQAQRDAHALAVADQKRREEEDFARRTQKAIDESIAKERERVGAVNAQAQPAPPSYNAGGVAPGEKQEGVTYCSACGSMCKVEDKFCRGCGVRRETQEAASGNLGGGRPAAG